MALSQDQELELLLLEREKRNRIKSQPSLLNQMADSIVDTALPVSAGVAGSVMGAPAGPVGAAVGGAAGYATGKSLSDLIQRFRGKKELLRDIGGAASELRDNMAAGISGEITGKAIGDIAKPVFKAAGDLVAKSKAPGKFFGSIARTMSGVDAAKGERLFNDPTALFTKSVKAAGDELGSIRNDLGMIVKKSNADVFAGEASIARTIARDAMDAIDKGEIPAAPYLLRASQAIDDVIEATPMKQIAHRRDLFEKKAIIQDLLSSLSGEEREASKQYSRSVLASNFRRLFPVTKQGDVSVARTYFLPSLQGTAAGVVPAMFGVGMGSPLLWGAGVSAAGLGFKGAGRIAEGLASEAATPLYRSLGFTSSQKTQKKNKGGFPLNDALAFPRFSD